MKKLVKKIDNYLWSTGADNYAQKVKIFINDNDTNNYKFIVNKLNACNVYHKTVIAFCCDYCVDDSLTKKQWNTLFWKYYKKINGGDVTIALKKNVPSWIKN